MNQPCCMACFAKTCHTEGLQFHFRRAMISTVPTARNAPYPTLKKEPMSWKSNRTPRSVSSLSRECL